jgi:hypothetical protein
MQSLRRKLLLSVGPLLVVGWAAWFFLHSRTSGPPPIPKNFKSETVAVSQRIPMPLEVVRHISPEAPVTGNIFQNIVEVKYPGTTTAERSFNGLEERLRGWLQTNHRNLPVANIEDASQLAEDLIRLYECRGGVHRIDVLEKHCHEKCWDSTHGDNSEEG